MTSSTPPVAEPLLNAAPALGLHKIVLITHPGHRKDALVAIIQSMPAQNEISWFATLAESEAKLKTAERMLVILDHEPGETRTQCAIPIIRQWNRRASILLLVQHPGELFPDTARPDALIFDGFSSTSLAQEMNRLKV